MRVVIALAALALAAASPAAAAAPCGPTDPAGRYQGQAKTPDGLVFENTINLRCDAGRYAVHIFTPLGDFPGDDVALADGYITLTFTSGIGAGAMRLTVGKTEITGDFHLAGQPGTLALRRVGDAWPEGAWTPHLDLTTAEWREDLAYLARELPRRHANAFAFLPKTEFEARVAALDRRLPRLGPDQVFVALTQLVNAIGDGHTGVVSPADKQNMPLELAQVDGQFRVVAAGAGLERALGARVVAIGGTPIAKAHRLALTLTPTQELPELREGRVVYYLARGLTLHGLGITPRRDRATYTFADDRGRRFSLEVHGLGTAIEAPMTRFTPATALAAQNPGDDFWCRALPDAHAVYCDWRGYPTLHAKVAAMWAMLKDARPDKLILDMRDNGGGDNTIGEAELVAPLKASAEFNRPGRLYVLIGPLTFSAAMNNAAQLQDQTAAILVGQTIGEKPNSYQEPRQFALPNSHLIVRASTLYYTFRKSGENAVRPNHEVIPTWADLKAGRDPALAWVLAQPPAR